VNAVWLQQMETEVPEGIEWLSASERVHLSELRFPKRRCDWRLGRWTAKRAVAIYLGRTSPAPLNDIEIRPALSGAPEAFVAGQRAEFSISLSHRMNAAMVALSPSGGPVGCDLESIEPHSQSFVADYFTPEEQLAIRGCSACDQAALVSLLWSAKESALKALHLGLRIDTRRLFVSFAEDAGTMWKGLRSCQEELFRISRAADCNLARHGWRDFTVIVNGDLTLHGRWQRSANLVRTLIADAALLPPASLDCHN
jgi:4'-phosphopantetheinyl transferase